MEMRLLAKGNPDRIVINASRFALTRGCGAGEGKIK
jgi:hypothetical protein